MRLIQFKKSLCCRPKNYENNYKKVPLKDIDESEEETELFTYKSRFKEIPTVEKIVEDGDTLQAISIRYHCSVSINNICLLLF